MKIGFFDSGLGGLLILRAVAKLLPQFDYVYYGDTAHLPYGDKTEAEIYQLTKVGVEDLFSRGCVLVVIACNTASAQTLRKLQDELLPHRYPDRKILGVIIPTIETLITKQPGAALLLATKRTVDSQKYSKELEKREVDQVRLYSVATPLLVPLIEHHKREEAYMVALQVIREHCNAYPAITTVVLGCTHYTLLKERLREALPHLSFIAQDEVIPEKLAEYLQVHSEIRHTLSENKQRTIILTEHRQDYDEIASDFLQGAMVRA